MDLARGAGILCANKRVWEYINVIAMGEVCKSQRDATEFMYSEFGIQSRRELNSNPEAAARYQQFVRNFNDWNNGR